MHYFIDGYNLLFRVAKAGDGDLQRQREKIIEDLSQKINAFHISATIVFDSHYQKGLREKNYVQNFEILFTDEGETADECILDELKRVANPRKEIVVTSDKKLAWQARIKGAHTQTVEDFFALLNQRWRKRIQPSLKKKVSKEIPPLNFPVEQKETVDEYYLRSFEAALAEDPYYKKVREKQQKRISDFERWLNAFQKDDNDWEFGA